MHAHELALKVGRQLQSPLTGLVHLCYEEEGSRDTIPVLENVAFALALLRTRKSEQVLEAKAILEKILAFEVEGNFPIYLHDYPTCRDSWIIKRLSPYFFWAVKDFGAVLGSLKARLERFVLPPNLSITPQSAADWAELCIAAQMAGQAEILQQAADQWNKHLCLYVGPSLKRPQEGGEPALSLLDLMMGEWTGKFSQRALKFHPLQLRASLIQPATVTARDEPYVVLESDGELPLYIAWGDHQQLHTFALAKKHLRIEGNTIIFPEEVPEEGDKSYELSFYLNVHPDHQITFGGKRASAFQLQDEICIESNVLTLRFHLEGKGQFFGHLMRGNRPSQLKKDVYDWKFAIRTISREPHCSLTLRQTLDYRQPLP